MTDLQFGIWVSRIVRWLLALLFAYLAFSNEGLWYLYIFAALLFLTGFFAPKRCIETKLNKAGEKANCSL
jgi:hypothetical protein